MAAALPLPFTRILSSSLSKLLFSQSPSSPSMTIHHHHHKDPIIVIMGATGTGKTKLSLDIATRFGSEIVNSDKIQVYSGLDITTNKIPVPDRRGVPHHILGSVDPSAGELTASSFRSLADSAIKSILSRRKVPVIAGGSNSLIQALVWDPKRPDPFRYRCCFIWVDVARKEMREYLDRRVDEMVGSGMVEELERYFRNEDKSTGAEWERNVGLNKAIGVPEFWGYFGKMGKSYEEAVREIKENTWRLAEKQVGKIQRLGEVEGWGLRRVDATGAVRAMLGGAPKEVEEERWGRDVVGPAALAVEKFLEDVESRRATSLSATATAAVSCACYHCQKFEEAGVFEN